MYTREEAEGKRLRHPFDTITGKCGGLGWTGQGKALELVARVQLLLACWSTPLLGLWGPSGVHTPAAPSRLCVLSAEGIGINRLTQNFSRAQIDGAFKGSDREAVEMVGGKGRVAGEWVAGWLAGCWLAAGWLLAGHAGGDGGAHLQCAGGMCQGLCWQKGWGCG